MTIEQQRALPIAGIHHIAVRTHALEGSLRLYRDVLGMPVVNRFGKPEKPIFLLAAGGGSHIELSAPVGLEPPPAIAAEHPLLHIALTTADLRGVIERVRSAGYEVTVEPKDVRLGPLQATIAFFQGEAGERIELFQTNSE